MGTAKEGALIGGYDLSWQVAIDANARSTWNPPLTAGQTAATWTKSTTSSGTAAMSAGHTILSGTVDMYWTGGFRAGMTAVVTDDSVAVSGGAGDNVPESGVSVLLCQQVAVAAAFEADALALIVASATYRSLLSVTDDDAGVTTFELLPTAGLLWHNQSAMTNPLDGKTIVSATMSTTDPTDSEKPITFGIEYDSTPSYPG